MSYLPELPLYIFCWILSSSASLIALMTISQQLKSDIRVADYLDPGWSSLGFKRESADIEWQDFKRALFVDHVGWFVGHIIITSFFRYLFHYNPAKADVTLFYKKISFICYGLAYACHSVGFLCLVLMLVEIGSMWFLAKRIRWIRSRIWIVSVIWIGIIQYFLHSDLAAGDIYHRSMQFSSLAYTVLRCIYFAQYVVTVESEYQKRNEKFKSEIHLKLFERQVEMSDVLYYCFYMPVLTFGQLLVFEEFVYQMDFSHHYHHHHTETGKSLILKKLLRVMFWTLFYEVASHFCYAFSLIEEQKLMWHIPLLSLVGLAYYVTQVFTVKYVILWSATSFLASLDGLKTPALPFCTSHSHLTSDIWRTFDSSLYTFIKRNIYIPLGGSKKGIFQQMFACASSFIFAYFWHGTSQGIFLWCLTGWFSTAAEVLVHRFASEHKTQLNRMLSTNNQERIKCILLSINMTIFLSGTWIFLGGNNLCYAVLYRVFVSGFPVNALTFLFCIYCGLQTATAWRQFKVKDAIKRI